MTSSRKECMGELISVLSAQLLSAVLVLHFFLKKFAEFTPINERNSSFIVIEEAEIYSKVGALAKKLI